MSATNKQFVVDYLEALSGKPKPANVISRYVDDVALQEHIEMFEAAFPQYELLVDEILAEGDLVAVRTTFRGVHAGEFQGIAPTGKTVTIPVMLIYRVRESKIVEHWLNADALSLLQQLGALPVPA
jgi:predicted ester cyclase